jgi:riboflavin kinase / FMN adenylyltransferase
MKIVRKLSAIPDELRGTILALGNFDGVHKGHQKVLNAALEVAKKAEVPCGAMVFEPHPREFFNPAKPVFRLTPIDAKLVVFEAIGLDYCVVIPFDDAFSRQSAAVFVAEGLVGALDVRHVVAGYDFHFGHKRQGNPEFLQKQGEKLGFATTIVAPLESDGVPYSSSGVRTMLEAGDVAAASNALGYHWFVRGEVIDGDKRGRDLGFPTANMAMPASCRLKLGIYAVRMRRNGPNGLRVHDGVASYGVRPTFGGGVALLETFLFEFDENIYGETVEIEMIGYIRPELKFDDVDTLVRQMHADTADAKALLAAVDDQDFTDLDNNLASEKRKL